MEHLRHFIKPVCISAHESHSIAVAMWRTREVDSRVMNDAYQSALGHHSQLVQRVVVCCRRKLIDALEVRD